MSDVSSVFSTASLRLEAGGPLYLKTRQDPQGPLYSVIKNGFKTNKQVN